MEQKTPVDLLSEALKRYVKSGSLLRQIEDGRLHEGAVLETLCLVAISAGVSAKMVKFKASNYPLGDRDLDFKPKGYKYQSFILLEANGELLAFRFKYPSGRQQGSRLIASRYRSQAHARKNLAPLEHFAWKTISDEFPLENHEHLIPANLETDLRAAVLAQKTPQAPSRKPLGRL